MTSADRLKRLLLTTGGLGELRPAPGTWGSLPPPAIALLIVWLFGPTLHVHLIMVLIAIIFTVICVWLGRFAEQHFGRKDPSHVVADETAGQAVALCTLPWVAMSTLDDFIWNAALAAMSFILFRLMDIFKPPPANQLQRLPAGWGIVVDDLVAGIYALALAHLLIWSVFPLIF